MPKGASNLGYVYELIDNQTGMWYVGSRTATGCSPEDLGVSYFTCSRLVEPLFRENAGRFNKSILFIGEPDLVIREEALILKVRDARHDMLSYNMSNGDEKFNPVKAAQSTVTRKIGVHNRTKEARVADARKGGLLGGKISTERCRPLKKGIFARTLEEMQAAGKYASAHMSLEQRRINGKQSGEKAKREKLGYCGMTTDRRKENGHKAAKTHARNRTGIYAMTKEELSAAGKKAAFVKFRCLECKMISGSGGLASHQRTSGHSGKERVSVQS